MNEGKKVFFLIVLVLVIVFFYVPISMPKGKKFIYTIDDTVAKVFTGIFGTVFIWAAAIYAWSD